MASSKELSVRAEALKIENQLKEKEIFESHNFFEYIRSMIDSVLVDNVRNIKLTMEYNPNNKTVAYTTGDVIYINSGNSISNNYSLTENKVIALLGIAFHECAHIKYLDFEKDRLIMKEIENGTSFGEFEHVYPEDEDTIKDIIQCMTKKEYQPLFSYVYHTLSNIMSDVHDETCIINQYHGLIEKGIIFARESMCSTSISLENMMKSLDNGTANKLSIMYSLILQFARYGKVVIEDESKIEDNELLDKLYNISYRIQQGCTTDDIDIKYNAINQCVLTIWEYIKEMLEKQDSEAGSGDVSSNHQSQSNENSSNNQNSSTAQNGKGQEQNNSSEQSIQNVLNTLKEAAQQSLGKQSGMPNNLKSGPQKSSNSYTQNSGKTSSVSDEEAKNIINNILSQIKKEISEEKAETNIENILNNEENVIINAVDQTSTHKGKNVTVRRYNQITNSDKKMYNQYLKKLAPIAKNLQRKMENILKDMNEGYVAKHRIHGKRIEASDTYKVDGRFFSTKKLPGDLPRMAISVLIDMSGSMCGKRIAASKEAAILLYEFASSLGIPIMIAGHCTHNSGSDGIEYHVYTKFDRISKNNKYRLVNISEKNERNRDGMAIAISSDMLSRRDEEIKLLIIISDGQPNDIDYGGNKAKIDIQSIIRKYKKKGIETIAMAIGDDKERIKDIYRDSFLDITDVSDLPKTMVKVVKKRLLNY